MADYLGRHTLRKGDVYPNIHLRNISRAAARASSRGRGRREINHSRNVTPMRHPIVHFATMTLACLAVVVFAYVVATESMVGCGEKTYYPDRTWTTNECVFIPHKPVSGRW